jgi:hypothetical protein
VKLKLKSSEIKCYLRIFNNQNFNQKFKKDRQISIHGSSRVAKKYRRDVSSILLSYLACSQIWLNLPMGDPHFLATLFSLDFMILNLDLRKICRSVVVVYDEI